MQRRSEAEKNCMGRCSLKIFWSSSPLTCVKIDIASERFCFMEKAVWLPRSLRFCQLVNHSSEAPLPLYCTVFTTVLYIYIYIYIYAKYYEKFDIVFGHIPRIGNIIMSFANPKFILSKCICLIPAGPNLELVLIIGLGVS
jgi:hypothetical protein